MKTARFPIIVTTYAGRNREVPGLLGTLASLLSIPVYSSCPSNVNISADHPMHAGLSFTGNNPHVEAADWILVLDCDVPW
jgi:thiamine pyrophosphate-dependent acetolactate synthase large subunit-like protein